VATPYAELADLQALFPRDLTEAEETRAEALLERASFWLGVWVPGLTDSTDGVVLEAAKYVVVDMVIRSLMSTAAARPDGAESMSRSAGYFSESIKFRNPDGNLFLYARELEDLEGLLRGNRSTAVSYMSPGL
jgi:hypothetical protein